MFVPLVTHTGNSNRSKLIHPSPCCCSPCGANKAHHRTSEPKEDIRSRGVVAKLFFHSASRPPVWENHDYEGCRQLKNVFVLLSGAFLPPPTDICHSLHYAIQLHTKFLIKSIQLISLRFAQTSPSI